MRDRREISSGDVDGFRDRWGMERLGGMDDAERRHATFREYTRDILGIDYDG